MSEHWVIGNSHFGASRERPQHQASGDSKEAGACIHGLRGNLDTDVSAWKAGWGWPLPSRASVF